MDDVRVSTIELFFDLVFVFTITQLTSLLVAEPTGVGVARVALIFGNVWWMYGGYAWLTNAVPPREPGLRLLMLVGMTGFLVVALAIPDAFGDSGVAFGIGYLVVTFVHTGLFLRSTEESAVRAMFRLGPYNTITAGLLLAAGFTHGSVRWALWIAAFVLHWTSPLVTAVGGFRIRAAHFVERHGLIVLISLGESVVAVGIGVQGHDLTGGLVVTAVLGLALAAVLWWLFFDGEDQRAEQALDRSPDARNPWLALFSFGYAFLPVLGGVVVLAAGMKQSITSYDEPATAATAWFLAGGVAVYIAGLVLFRVVLHTGPLAVRLAMVGAAVVTVLVGLEVSPAVQIGALALVVIAGIVIESRWSRTSTYVIRGGLEGRERLRVLARVMWPTTNALFARVGIESDARCLDLGCGGGDVTIALARLVPEGFVVGADFDETKLELARAEVASAGIANIEFRVDDVMEAAATGERFDVVYARFLLTHLADPAQALSNIRTRLVPGGVLIVEDIDFTGHFCHPESAAFRRYVELYTKAAEARGCDPNIGPRLPALLRGAGLGEIEMNVVQPAGFSGEVKLISPITLEAIADAVLAAGLATGEELNQTVDALYAFANRDGTLMSIPRVVQAWGRSPSG